MRWCGRPDPIEFSRGRLTGSGQGLTYAKNADVLTILERAIVRMAPNAAGAGALDISAGSAEFNRLEHVIRFNGGVKVDSRRPDDRRGFRRRAPDRRRAAGRGGRAPRHARA